MDYIVNVKRLPVIFDYIRQTRGLKLDTNEECREELAKFLDWFVANYGMAVAVESGLFVKPTEEDLAMGYVTTTVHAPPVH
jgi:hypothetical protein